MNDFKFNLFQGVKDRATGFTGAIMARTQYATACNTYGVCSRTLKEDGTAKNWYWLEEDRLVPDSTSTIE